MAEGDDDQDGKTEEPTERRLEEARERGQVINSREVGTALLFLAAVGLFLFYGSTMWLNLQEKVRFLLAGGGLIREDFTNESFAFFLREMILSTIVDLAPLFILFLLVSILGPLLQHGWIFTWEPVIPKLSKINPLEGFKRLFSVRSLVELFKSILKMAVVAVAVYLGIAGRTDEILMVSLTSIPWMTEILVDDAIAILWRVALAFLVLAIIDYLYQRFEYMRGLRMTKQEIRDEQKQLEGDPQIRARIRQVQREMARRRMMEEVPKADVVITNPTHFSVALQYKQGQMSAPKVVAKGRGEIAMIIRERAREADVPLVENPPLARALYKDVEIDQSIPAELFKAVAEVLAFVYRLRRNRPKKAS